MSETADNLPTPAESIEALIHAHRPKVYRACYRRLRHAADAEDATQEVFRKFLESAATIHGRPEAWLMACARNTCVDYVRRRRRRRDREAQRSQPEADRDPAIGRLETRELVHHVWQRLTAEEQDLLQQHLVERVPQTALAQQLGVSQQLVSRRVNSAKGKVRRWLAEHLGTLGLGGAVSLAGGGASRATTLAACWLHRIAATSSVSLLNPKSASTIGTVALALALPSSDRPQPNSRVSAIPPGAVGVYLSDFDFGDASPGPANATSTHHAAGQLGRAPFAQSSAPRLPVGSARPIQPAGYVAGRPVQPTAVSISRHSLTRSSEPLRAVAIGRTDQPAGIGRASLPTSSSPSPLPVIEAYAPPPIPLFSSARWRAFVEMKRQLGPSGRVFGRWPRGVEAAVIARVGPGEFVERVQAFGFAAEPFAALDLSGDASAVASAATQAPAHFAAFMATEAEATASWFTRTNRSAQLTPSKILNLGRMSFDGDLITADLKSPRGSELVLNGVNVFSGNVSGAGHWRGEGTAVLAGIHSPGDSPAFVDVGGSLVYAPGSALHLELAGVADGEYDRLTVAGEVSLAGELSVSLIDGFALSAGQRFLVLDVAGTVQGRFANYREGDRIAVVGETAGLTNAGLADLFITYRAGDGNDIALFTRGLSPFGAVPVPEPGVALGVLLMGPLLLGRRERGRSRKQDRL